MTILLVYFSLLLLNYKVLLFVIDYTVFFAFHDIMSITPIKASIFISRLVSILFISLTLSTRSKRGLNKKQKAFQLPRYIKSITSTITSNKPPAWFRALQIGSGIISLILSILLLLAVEYSVLTVNTIILLLSITLLTIGIEE